MHEKNIVHEHQERAQVTNYYIVHIISLETTKTTTTKINNLFPYQCLSFISIAVTIAAAAAA